MSTRSGSRGYELNVDYRLDASGVGVGATYSRTSTLEDAFDEDNPVGESYSRKFTGRLGYRDPGGRFWGQFEGALEWRAEGGRDLGRQSRSVQSFLRFTVFHLRGGVRLPEVGGFSAVSDASR